MGHHGQVTVGRDFDQAIQNAEFFELACEVILRGGSAVTPLSEDSAQELLSLGGKGSGQGT
jgi:ribulose-5-phosphate 4-epimerase/fuculose-1-phosphate aldolase